MGEVGGQQITSREKYVKNRNNEESEAMSACGHVNKVTHGHCIHCETPGGLARGV